MSGADAKDPSPGLGSKLRVTLAILWGNKFECFIFIVGLFLGCLLQAPLNSYAGGGDWIYVEHNHDFRLATLDVPFTLQILAVFFGGLFAIVGYAITLRKMSGLCWKHSYFPLVTYVSALLVVGTTDLITPHLLCVAIYYLSFLHFNIFVLSQSADQEMRLQVNSWKNSNTSKFIAYLVFAFLTTLLSFQHTKAAGHINHDIFNFVSGLISFEIILGSTLYLVGGADWFCKEWGQLALPASGTDQGDGAARRS